MRCCCCVVRRETVQRTLSIIRAEETRPPYALVCCVLSSRLPIITNQLITAVRMKIEEPERYRSGFRFNVPKMLPVVVRSTW